MKSSKTREMTPDRILPIGKIVGVHGLKGEVKAISSAESLGPFHPGKRILVKYQDGDHRPLTIKKAQPYKQILRMAFDGIDDRDAAETLVGKELCIRRSDLPETESDSWYWFDLIDLDVFTREDVYIGRVAEMIETGSNDVFVVRNGDAEILIPAIASVVIAIDLETRRMHVDLPEGL